MQLAIHFYWTTTRGQYKQHCQNKEPRNAIYPLFYSPDGLGLDSKIYELCTPIVRSHVSWRRERNIPYKGVETSP